MFCGERLKNLRIESGKSQKEVATLTGITQGAITNYECGRRVPDKETILKFCDLFGVQEAYFDDEQEIDKVRQLIDELRLQGILTSAEDVKDDVAELILNAVRMEITLKKLKKEQDN